MQTGTATRPSYTVYGPARAGRRAIPHSPGTGEAGGSGALVAHRPLQTTVSGSERPGALGPIWISVPMVGQTPQS
ncbi:hypothetical protein GCM10023405_35020 [Streptomonospora salina]